MTDSNDFYINPLSVSGKNTAKRSRRPLPPGQTRHKYEEDPEQEFDVDEINDDITDSEYDSEQERPSGIVGFFLDRRVAIWLGLTLLIVGFAVALVLLNFLKNGSLDQSVIMNLSPQQIVDRGIEVNNAGGPGGAWLGQLLFAQSFGIGAFIIAVYFIVVGWRLLTAKSFNFWGFTFRCALLAISISIVVGLITYAVSSKIFWGGVHGHYINKWLIDMTGVPGALFVSLLLIGTVIAVYFNELSRWRKKLRTRRESALLNDGERAKSSEVETENSETEVTDTTKNAPLGIPPSSGPVAVSDTPHDFTDSTDDVLNPFSDEKRESENPVNPEADDMGFEIDSPVAKDPGFEIDVAQSEAGKKRGTVAERLVAEHGEFDPRAELSRFKFPTLDLLDNRDTKVTADTEELQANKDRIVKTLGNYGITVSSIKATVGPTVTLYEIVPTEGIRITQIKRLEDDIAMSLLAKGIRIIAPMPGKGTVGIEVPNREPQVVSMRSILASKKFRESNAKLPVALGVTISNEVFITDLTSMPHALVAGATGQGKSVGLNALITSLLYRKHPTELKFVLIDPKKVEFSVYERLRGHYLASLPGEEDAIVTDPSKVLSVLNSLCAEMDTRYSLLKSATVNKIEDYNRKFCQRRLSIEKGHRYLPYIVVIIDEFADLIMTGGKEIEMPVMRITQLARAVGIHMVIATQRPSTNVLTGLIKANCPSRIAFRVQQNVDSRTILDRPGAERLIGRGDMLYSQGGELERMQCAFITSDEVEAICDFIDAQPGFERPYTLTEPASDHGGFGSSSLPAGGMDRDPLFDEAARFTVNAASASTSSLQRRFEIGYNRAGKIMDQMEAAGIVGPPSGAKPRAVLVDPVTLENILANR